MYVYSFKPKKESFYGVFCPVMVQTNCLGLNWRITLKAIGTKWGHFCTRKLDLTKSNPWLDLRNKKNKKMTFQRGRYGNVKRCNESFFFVLIPNKEWPNLACQDLFPGFSWLTIFCFRWISYWIGVVDFVFKSTANNMIKCLLIAAYFVIQPCEWILKSY